MESEDYVSPSFGFYIVWMFFNFHINLVTQMTLILSF
jgi:hypothetical protein